jgi:hypothetical protein
LVSTIDRVSRQYCGRRGFCMGELTAWNVSFKVLLAGEALPAVRAEDHGGPVLIKLWKSRAQGRG